MDEVVLSSAEVWDRDKEPCAHDWSRAVGTQGWPRWGLRTSEGWGPV